MGVFERAGIGGVTNMSKFYFYCPNCGRENTVDSLPKGTIGNIRDGYGAPIHHYECANCHNLDAGFMRYSLGKMGELPKEEQECYFRSVIKLYQDIRGIKHTANNHCPNCGHHVNFGADNAVYCPICDKEVQNLKA